LLTTEELAQMLKVSTRTLIRWRKEGLPHIQVGYRTIRYDLNEVMKWIENREIKKCV
jgi:excisionase family DNA binding protein